MPAKTSPADSVLRHARKKKKTLWIAGAALIAVLGGVAIARRSSSADSKPTTTTTAKKSTNFAAEAWPAGALATYRIAWKSDADVTVDVASVKRQATNEPAAAEEQEQKGTLATHLHIEGELTLRSYGVRDGAVVLGVVLSRVNVARAEALGRPTTNDLEAELRAGEAVAIVEPEGHVREIGFSAATTPTARGALRALVLEYTAEVSAANGQAIVDTSLGRARIEKTADGKTKRAFYDELDALPEGFNPEGTKVTSTGEGAVAGDGPAATVVASNEEISAKGDRGLVSRFHATTSLSATLIRTAKEPTAPIPSYIPASVRPTPAENPEKDEKDNLASLERRSVGVTAESLYADVLVASSLPQKGPTEWIWRDSAYLKLHPEQTSLLLDRAMKDSSIFVHGAAVDIVVISGSDAAQRALTHTFDSAKMSPDERSALFQHLQQLIRPSLDFLRWADAEHDKSKGTGMWLATSYTLGGLAWHASDEHPDAANRLVEKLEAELKVARTDEMREIALRALGNAGAARSLSLVVPHAKSKSADVRAAVASALRRMDGEASVDTLLTLVADEDSFVSSEAVESTYRKELSMEDWQTLAKAVEEDRVLESSHAALTNGALMRRIDNPECAPLLTALLTNPKTSYKLKERIASAVNKDRAAAPPSPQ